MLLASSPISLLRKHSARTICIVLATGLAPALCGCSRPSHTITFEITNAPTFGDGTKYIKVSRTNLHGGDDATVSTLPYEDQSTVTGSGFVTLSAISDDTRYPSPDQLSCQIKVDGQNLSSSKGDNTVSCSGMIR